MNIVHLIGNLGKDPEKGNGGSVKFSLATTSRFKDKNGEKQEKTQWHNIVAFGKQGEILEKYLKKGSKVYIDGEIEYYKKDDKYFTSIVVKGFEFLGEKSGGTASNTIDNEEIDSLPF